MVFMLLGTGFEETEAITPLDLLRRAGVNILTVGIDGKVVTGSHKIRVEADITLDEMDLTDMEMMIIPGGMGGVASLRACPAALESLKFAWENGKYVAAICAAPFILGELDLLEGRHATCFPGFEKSFPEGAYTGDKVTHDGNIITASGMAQSLPFALELLRTLAGDKAVEKVAEGIQL